MDSLKKSTFYKSTLLVYAVVFFSLGAFQVLIAGEWPFMSIVSPIPLLILVFSSSPIRTFIFILSFYAGVQFTLFDGIVYFQFYEFQFPVLKAGIYHFIGCFFFQLPVGGIAYLSSYLRYIKKTSVFGSMFLFLSLYCLKELTFPQIFPFSLIILTSDTNYELEQLFSLFGPETTEYFVGLGVVFLIMTFIAMNKKLKTQVWGYFIAFLVTAGALVLLARSEKSYWSQFSESGALQIITYQPSYIPPQDSYEMKIWHDYSILQKLSKSVREALNENGGWGGQLLFTPETLFKSDLKTERHLGKVIRQEVASLGIPFIVGGDSYYGEDRFNSYFLFDSQGDRIFEYQKRKLMPFGEYIPFYDSLPGMNWLFPAAESWAAGEKEKSGIFEVLGKKAGVLICYEDILTGFYQELIENNVQLIFSGSNDSSFGPTNLSRLHRWMAQSRAISVRRPLIRITTSGESVVTDVLGKNLYLETRDIEVIKKVELPNYSTLPKSFYSKNESKIPWLILFLTITVLFAESLWTKKKGL